MGERADAALRSLMDEVDHSVHRCREYGLPANIEAEGIRYTTELMRLALAIHVHNQDPNRPLLTEMIGPTMRWGWDNPYTTYHYSPIRGDATYRIFGSRNSSAYLGITVYGGGDERGGTMPTSVVGSVNDTTIPVGPDGRYEVILSSAAPASAGSPAWVRLDPDATSLIVRQYVTDPVGQAHATAHIERIPAAGPPVPLTDEELARRFTAARTYFEAMWAMSDGVVSHRGAGGFNRFNPPLAGGFDPEGRPSGYMYPTPDNLYTFGWYDLDEDETLVVRVTPPPCRYWSFYLGSVFQQSLPYAPRYGLITRENAVGGPDGSVTLIVSATDPGLPNWVGTQEHRIGMMALRWLLPETKNAPTPDCAVVAKGDLAARFAGPDLSP